MHILPTAFQLLTEQDLFALVVYGEARGEPIEGQVAVACTIRNRVNMDLLNDGKPDWWGESYRGVISKWAQYSCLWPSLGGLNYTKLLASANELNTSQAVQFPDQQILRVTDGVFDGAIRDNTHNATHYYATNIAPPAWTKGATLTAKLGNHLFYAGVK